MLIHLFMKPYLQPFERLLALMEARALTHGEPIVDDDGWYCVQTSTTVRHLAEHLVYWETVRTSDGVEDLTEQVKLEATANLVMNGVSLEGLSGRVPFRDTDSIPVPRRRVLRYGLHGIHEYRGKFFPQLVGALLNIMELPPGSVVLDPFCGSGTAPVEVMTKGMVALATDLNPLSAWMTETKLGAFEVEPEDLKKEYEAVEADITLIGTRQVQGDGLNWFDRLPSRSRSYLVRWFPDTALEDLDAIMVRLQRIKDRKVRNLFKVSLSNILRRVSWQKTDDLRVRRDIESAEAEVVKVFLAELNRSTRHIYAFLKQYRGARGSYQVRIGDARRISDLFPQYKHSVDAVITSPPYATALPYIDTDRLSLAYLNLLDRGEQKRIEGEMIGTRELSRNKIEEGWRYFSENEKLLPQSVREVIHRIHDTNSRSTAAGFRRRNLPSLLARYFFDMRRTLESLMILLRPGAPLCFVVGSNHTIANGERIPIDTAGLLADTAAMIGYDVESRLEMEVLISRDIFRANASNRESLVFLRTPK